MYRTRIETLIDRVDNSIIYKRQTTWNHPRNVAVETILEDDGTGRVIMPGQDFGALLLDTPPSFLFSITNGITTPYNLQWDYSDAFTFDSVIGYVDNLAPDDALVDSLSPTGSETSNSGGQMWHRYYNSDGTIGFGLIDQFTRPDLFSGCLGSRGLGGEWQIIAERFQTLAGGFPQLGPPAPPQNSTGDQTTVEVTAIDRRSKFSLTQSRACLVRQEIGNDAQHHCEVSPSCVAPLQWSLLEADTSFILTTSIANESVGVKCGECPI